MQRRQVKTQAAANEAAARADERAKTLAAAQAQLSAPIIKTGRRESEPLAPRRARAAAGTLVWRP
jgi:hypothetical protein